jgi:hypothetical protein
MRYIYFIQAGMNGPIKIGFSDNVPNRLAALQTSNYEKLHLLASLQAPLSKGGSTRLSTIKTFKESGFGHTKI